jgi:hypothetical protein
VIETKTILEGYLYQLLQSGDWDKSIWKVTRSDSEVINMTCISGWKVGYQFTTRPSDFSQLTFVRYADDWDI